MHHDEHFTQRSVGLWNHLCSLVKQHAPTYWSASAYGNVCELAETIA
jgi:hypothetical protein